MKHLYEFLPIAFLIIVWWVGVWGFLDTLVQLVSKGNATTSLFLYGGLAGSVLFFLLLRPHYLEHFV